jgi:YHS domain-containing protein
MHEQIGHRQHPPASLAPTETDLVCGMEVRADSPRRAAGYRHGHDVSFCSARHRARFRSDRAKFRAGTKNAWLR